MLTRNQVNKLAADLLHFFSLIPTGVQGAFLVPDLKGGSIIEKLTCTHVGNQTYSLSNSCWKEQSHPF
jgi:hypothetical protein